MTYDLQKIVTFVLKSQGLKEITESDFVNYLSVKKRLVTPAEAKKILEKCIAGSVVLKDGEVLKPRFDLEDTVVEPDFKIAPEVMTSDKVDTFIEIVKYLADKSGKDRKEIVAEINTLAEDTCTLPVVAALIYAKMNGIDARRFYEAVEREILENPEK
ncbi:MAG: DUF2240 family protein [Thermoplasmata archaeon]|nr:DUF2240 family protein [Thermoplasmata archaeon]